MIDPEEAAKLLDAAEKISNLYGDGQRRYFAQCLERNVAPVVVFGVVQAAYDAVMESLTDGQRQQITRVAQLMRNTGVFNAENMEYRPPPEITE